MKPKKKKTETEYTAKDIYVLRGLEPVRKRPAMYIGSTGPDGLHHLLAEVVGNAIDEAIMGYCTEIEVSLLAGEKIKVKDNGRGIPVEVHPQTKKSALETVMTYLHKGAKFGGKVYVSSGGLHGVGVAVVCALSKHLRAEVCRDGFRYYQEYEKGKPLAKVKKAGTCKERGTTVIFEPDSEIFKEIKFDLKKILNYLRQQAYLTPGFKIKVIDQRKKTNETYAFYFDSGLPSYIKYLTRGIASRHQNIYYGKGEKDGILVEVALLYTEEYECYEESFANNIYTEEGGTHLTGFRTALTRSFNDYSRKNGFLKKADENLTGEDIREGLTGVVAIKLKDPQFEGQTKAKLGNSEAKVAVEAVISETLADFLERNPQDARAIIEKCVLAQKARKAAKVAKETVLKRGILEGLALPGKLADCTSRKPEESELYIVEGESAGGCFSGNTKVALTDGRNLSFKELIEEDKERKRNYCYTIKKDGSIGIELIKNPRKTKSSAEVIKVILDNGEKIICTPDHRFMLRDGFYREAKNLTSQDSLMPLRRQLSRLGKRITIKGYELVYDNRDKRWIFTHLLADDYNLRNNIYSEEYGTHRHHIDFNKLNNNPDNIRRIGKEEHMEYHRQRLQFSIHRKDIQEKSKRIRQTKEFREKMSRIMSKPEMREMLSERAKKQWENEEYKQYMIKKFLDFYKKNQKYQEKNKKLLYENQKIYWSNSENRRKWGERVYDTICRYFFENDEERLKEAVLNYNHKIKKIVKLRKRMNVYDLEVLGTHNFALASGIFVHNSGKQARDRHFQAILPLRGKILNVERARLDKILASKEIKSLIIALGTAIAEDFNLEKLRYHRIIIMADADSITGDTPILLFNKEKQEFFLTEVGKFIENCNDTTKYQVLTYNSKNKKRELKEIYQTIKHPLRTPLYEIKTYCGYPIKVTACHSVYVYENGEIITKKGNDIKEGDLFIFPKSFPHQEKEYVIDFKDVILNSNFKNISIKIPKKEIKQIPARAWCELDYPSWIKLQRQRELARISRRAMGESIGIYDKVIQQWEQKIDNVMPRFCQFESYLNQLEFNKNTLDYNVYIPIKEWQQNSFPENTEFYLENHTRKIKTEFRLDEDLAYLIGFFLGDGCSTSERGNPNRFSISLNKEKADKYIENLSQIIKGKFNAKPILEYRESNNIQLHFHSFDFKLLLAKLELFGKKCNEKFIPNIFFNTKRKVQEALLKGLLESDGFITVWPKDKPRKVNYGWRLSSQPLIEGMLTIFRQWEIFPAYTISQSKDHLRQDGKVVHSNFKSYDLSISTVQYLLETKNIWESHKDAKKLEGYLEKVNYKKVTGKYIELISEDFVGLRVKEIKRIKNPKDKFIYDFSVWKDQNFIAGVGGILLKNSDGNHIRTLLLTLFFRHFKPIIEKGYLHIAQPPLYKIQTGKEIKYAYSEDQKLEVLKLMKKTSGISIQRYKGLGEMNPEELWSTTMNPENRVLLQVTIENAKEADRIFDILMGDEVLPRKKFIQTYAKKVKNLDI